VHGRRLDEVSQLISLPPIDAQRDMNFRPRGTVTLCGIVGGGAMMTGRLSFFSAASARG
jgi:hypothetical protein